jgi:3'(2'), 5'-bisphosphate nucleotidase
LQLRNRLSRIGTGQLIDSISNCFVSEGFLDRHFVSSLIEPIVAASLEAGRAILDIYATDFEVAYKGDNSPVTAADQAADVILSTALEQHAPGIFVVSEEQGSVWGGREVPETFFLVDPLDGTKEFLKRKDDFTVNVALIHQRRPILGVVYAPARGWLLAGDVLSGVAWEATGMTPDGVGADVRSSIRVRVPPVTGISAVSSASHNSPATDEFLSAYTVADRIAVGSSLKFCMVAAGRADIYPRMAPTCEWDTAAGDAVLRAAGGAVLNLEGETLLYGKPDYFNPGFIAHSPATGIDLAALGRARDLMAASPVPAH